MKYIRTEDKIMVFADLPYDIDNNGNQSYKGMKIADSIEGLCDGFVLKAGNKEDVNKNAYTMLDYCPKLNQMLIHPGHRFEIYGAIWTEWGLKYIAKMNEKGELELI